MKTPKEIKEFLNNKVLVNISGNTPKVETISIDDFLEWFESKPKEENQDIITFEGKEYEFIECDYASLWILSLLSPIFKANQLRCMRPNAADLLHYLGKDVPH